MLLADCFKTSLVTDVYKDYFMLAENPGVLAFHHCPTTSRTWWGHCLSRTQADLRLFGGQDGILAGMEYPCLRMVTHVA